ncbi:T9SS type A sorting domain-containing protein [candidate division KSB1 bacterium]|nr:T9SS type A sorting domain-containing protein [candidate division KSB1 bacterium]
MRIILLITVVFSNAFAVSKEMPIYIHPKDNARDISTQTTLLIKYKTPETLNLKFEVKGQKSGPVSGKVIRSGNTVIFKPARNFAPGEAVFVRVTGERIMQPLSYHFQTSNIEKYDPKILYSASGEIKADQQLEVLAKPGKPASEMTIINGVPVPSDYDAMLLFGAGLSGTGIYIDSVAVRQVGEYNDDFDEMEIPQAYKLGQNFPNPFNPVTTISYRVPDMSQVTITLYNILGQKIKTLVDGHHAFGDFTINVNATGLNAGVYFYRMEARSDDGKKSHKQIKKMTVVK